MSDPTMGPWCKTALGFRLFFFFGALFAAGAVPLWLIVFRTGLSLPSAVLAVHWHGHEMVFGFATAIVAGFLLTAVGNWTGRPTAVGLRLLGLGALWILGRAALLFGGLLPTHLSWLAGTADLAFVPMLALTLAVPLIRARNFRNFGFVGLLSLLFVANLLFHTEWIARARATIFGLDVILLAIVMMGGRVIPMFTQNAIPGVSIGAFRSLDWACLIAAAAMAACDLFGYALGANIFAVLAGVANDFRLSRWHSVRTARHPILWVLHAGYGWLVVGLVLKGLAPLWPALPPTAALHALTVGAVGVLTLGMMARVALGHTGRPLEVHSAVVLAFVSVNAAAFFRALGPMLFPSHYLVVLDLSATLWTIAFVIYAILYLPILARPRVDGKPG